MKKLLFMLVGVLLLSAQAQATKLYKIVNPDGSVSFSQFPPTETTKQGEVESVKISGGGSTQVKVRGDYEYCGEIQLMRKPSSTYRYSHESFSRNLDSRLRYWEQQLENLEKNSAARSGRQLSSSMDRNKSRYQNQSNMDRSYNEGLARDTQRMRDLRCAVDWARESRRDISDRLASNDDERTRLQGVKDKLQAQLDSKCGALPPYDPTDAVAESNRKSWYNCSKDLRQKLKTVDSKLRYL